MMMGTRIANSGCKRHLHEHLRQLPGICPTCLREKLSQLNTTSDSPSTTTATISGSNSPLSLSSFSSASNSPRRFIRRNQSDITYTPATITSTRVHRENNSNSSILSEGLKKSRSVTCAVTSDTAGILKKKVKKGGGLWRKLIRSAGRKVRKMDGGATNDV